jgi:manganese transport system ATP-binding protein
VLLLHRILFHGEVSEALRPENLARAFGLDVLDHDVQDEGASA